jgi:hypothetical protein
MDLFYGDFLASIRVFRGPLSLLFFVIRHLEVAILFVSIRVHSWLKVSRGEDPGLD